MGRQIYDVLPARPFGKGITDATISADPCARARVLSGTAGQLTINIDQGMGTFVNGDLVLIHITREVGAPGQWEVNQIVSGVGTGTYTLLKPLDRNYVSTTGIANSSQAQVCQIKEYRNLTLNSFTGEPWRSNEQYVTMCRGGFVCLAVSELLLINGTINENGANGWATGQDHNGQDFNSWMQNQVGGGFRGGTNTTDGNDAGVGEGYSGNFLVEQNTQYANGGSGGGGPSTSKNGSNACSADLLQAIFGGGSGGGRGNNSNDTSSSGANGGGGFFIWARRLRIIGAIQAKGGQTSGSVWSSGGLAGNGAGGFCLINSELPDIGTDKIDVKGGAAVSSQPAAPDGVIRVNFGLKLTGNSSLGSLTSVRDPRLIIPSGGIIASL